jgi:hypothetical protein
MFFPRIYSYKTFDAHRIGEEKTFVQKGKGTNGPGKTGG